MCSQYPFPQKSEIPFPESLTEQRKPSLLQIYFNRGKEHPQIWLNATFIAQNESLNLDPVSASFPQDCYVLGDQFVIVSEGFKLNNPSKFPIHLNDNIFQGGCYAFGNDTVFCAFNNPTPDDINLVSLAFPKRQVYIVPTPHHLGLVRQEECLTISISTWVGL